MAVPAVAAAVRPGPHTRLLWGMTECVSRIGYPETTVSEVLAVAGASRSSFYDYFEDKDACLLAAAEEIGERLLTIAADRMHGAEAQLAPVVIAEAVLGFAEEDEAQSRLLFTELLAGGSRALDLRDSLIDRIASLIEEAWERGAGETPTCDLPAKALVGAIFRLLSARMRQGIGGLHDLQPAVLAWLGAYFVKARTPQWQSTDWLAGARSRLPTPTELPSAPRPRDGRTERHLPAQVRAHNQRQRLLGAFTTSVYEDGYAAMSFRDVARRARVANAVLYRHFPDKETAALEVLRLALEHTMSAFTQAFFAESGWPNQIWAGARALTEACAAAPELTYLAYVEADAAGPRAATAVQVHRISLATLLLPGYQRPEAEGLPRSVSEIVACAAFELLYRKHPHEFADLLPQLAYLMLAPFMGAHGATSFIREH